MEQNEVQGIKISQLDELTSIQDDDVLASVDTSEIKTTKVKASTLKSYINKEVNAEITTIKNDYALKESIPTKTSQLNNDSGFINKSVNNLDNYYNKTEIDTKVQTINTTTNDLNTRLTTAEKNIETNKTDIKDLSNRTKRIETDIFDSGEASGTGINLQDSTLAEFQEVKIDGVCKQETTSGKNLANINDSIEKPDNIWNFTIGEVKANKNYSLYINVDGVISFHLKYKGNSETIKSYYSVTGKKVINFTSTKDDSIYFNCFEDGSSEENYKGMTEIMLVEGTYTSQTIGEYEPYTGKQPSPSPDYPQPIEVITEDFDLVSCGKNLFDKDSATIENNYVKDDNGNEISSTSSNYTTSYTKVMPNTTYTFSYNLSSAAARIYYYDEEKNWISRTVNIINAQNSYTFTTPNNCHYLQFQNVINYIVDNKAQLEKGSTATEYEPYTETRQTITMPDGEFAGKIDDIYKDQFRINYNEEDGKYHLYLDKVVGKAVLNGSESWTIINNSTPNYSYFVTRKYDSIIGFNTFIEYSTHFSQPNTTIIPDYITDKPVISGSDANKDFKIRILIPSSVAKDIQTFKTWLSQNNVEVYYVLATPYQVDLGVVDMPLSYSPETNVFTTSELNPNMYVKYYRDFRKTITTMQVDIEELKNAVQTLTNNQSQVTSQVSTLSESQITEESEVVE